MNVRRSVWILFTTCGLAGCGGDFGDTGSGGSGGGTGSVRLVNASQSAFLDLYDSSTALSTGVALYGAGNYVSLPRGSRVLGVRAQGSSATLATATVPVVRDDHQALVAYQTVGTFATATVPEDEAAPSSNSAKLRVFNTASADAGSVDVYVAVATTTCAAIAASTMAATAATVSGLQTGYAQLAAATAPYRVCVTGAGVRTDLRLDIPALTLSNLRIVTLVLARTPANKLQALTIDQQGAVAALAGTAP